MGCGLENSRACAAESGFSTTADGNNHLPLFSYDSSGNTQSDGTIGYTWDGESQLKSATNGGTTTNYTYDGEGRRVSKVGSKLYWYGSCSDILAETDASGNTTAEYIFFGGKRIAMLPGNAISNGGFEQGLSGWTPWGTGITAQLITNPTTCHSGSNCLQLSNSTGGISGDSDSQQVPVTNGQTVTFGGWIYQQSGADCVNGSASWLMGAYAQNGLNYVQAQPCYTSPGWHYQTATYTITYTDCPCYVTLYTQLWTSAGLGTNVALFDDGFITLSQPNYYVEDLLGTSRVITTNTGVVCYDADFYPFGGERPYTNACPQNYKFEGKERDTETGNDDFGARYYSNRFARWLSADWSSTPAPVPYANLTNPQTLNLYSMVADDPESFADLDGHQPSSQMCTMGFGSAATCGPMVQALIDAHSQQDCNGLSGETSCTQCDNGDECSADQQGQQPQAQNQTPFNPTVTYDKNLSAKDLAADQSKVGAAIGVINANWSKLSDQEKATIGNIKSIDVSGSAQRSYVQESSGKLTLTQDYVSKSSKAWLASAIGHDGEHVALFNSGGIGASRGIPAEVKAMQFQLRVGTTFGLSATETKYLQGLIQNPSQLQRYINTPP